ncbi:MAG: efflux RND transporter periplasmic adaptor subunit [Phycisphaerales bacterium]|nr:efflux RND transporter periplasmic adaptor subunit [Phycisphaerales bacterium]
MLRQFVLLAVLLATCSSLAHAQGGPPPAKVVLDAARMELLTDRRVATGEIRSPMRSQLAVQVQGLVIEMLVNEGDSVTRNQIIAQLDPMRAQLDLQRAQAGEHHASAVIEQRKAELGQAERDLERIKELERRGSVGASEMDDARSLLASRKAIVMQAESDLLTAQADTQLAKRALGDTTIRAPFAGQVVQTHTEVGQWIDRGGAVATVLSLTDLEARVNIPQQYFAAIAGSKAEIEIIVPAIGSSVTGELIAIIPQADSLSRLFPVRILIHDPDRILRPGMSVKAMIPTGISRELLTVSKDAIVRTPSGEHLFFNADGVAALMPVTRLFGVGDRVAIKPGILKEGMQIIVDGNERIYPGQRLLVLETLVPVIRDTEPTQPSGEQE